MPNILSQWQDIVTEYHNRLDEFLRLIERNASSELLLEHQSEANQGIDFWRIIYQKTIGNKSPTKSNWVKTYFPDLRELELKYSQVMKNLKQIFPDTFNSLN